MSSSYDHPHQNRSHPVAPGAADARGPFSVYVQDTNPLWFYCRQTAHCGRGEVFICFTFASPLTYSCSFHSGMVFAINAPPEGSDRSFSAFKALAIAQNGTAETSAPPAPSPPPTAAPPPPVWHTATATVSSGASTWLTTYTSYEGTPGKSIRPPPMFDSVSHRHISADFRSFSGRSQDCRWC